MQVLRVMHQMLVPQGMPTMLELRRILIPQGMPTMLELRRILIPQGFLTGRIYLELIMRMMKIFPVMEQ